MTKASDYRAKLLQRLQSAGEQKDTGVESFLDLASSDDQIAALVDRLADSSTSPEKQLEALAKLHVIRNFSKVLPTRSAELTNALRGLINASDPEVRRQALSFLSIMGDEEAQSHLRSELQSGKPENERSVPTHMAIAMLSAHDKPVDKGLLLEIAINPPDEKALVQAVRHMPADNETLEVLTNILQDDSKPLAARALVPDIVNNVDPARFAALALQMLREKGAGHEISPFLARGVANIQQDKPTKEVEETRSIIRSMSSGSSESFQKAAGLLDKPDEDEQDN